MGELHTSTLGTTFPALDAETAAWLIPAVELVTAVSATDPPTVGSALARAKIDLDTVTGLAILASRLLAELGDEGEAWLRDLAVETAHQLA